MTAGGGTDDDWTPEQGEHEAEEHATLYVVIVCVLALVVGTVIRQFETQILPRCQSKYLSAPPYTLAVFLVGFALSVGVDFTERSAFVHRVTLRHLHSAVAVTQFLDPHVILLALLPPLLYHSASSLDYHVFNRVRGQAFLLAFPGVIIQLVLTAWASRWLFSYGEDGGPWGWSLALTFGSIVCATDPVAVVSTLHSLGAPERLSDVIEGESLLNDGSAYVMLLIFLNHARADYAEALAADAGEHGMVRLLAETVAGGAGSGPVASPSIGDAGVWGAGFLFFFRLAMGGVAWGYLSFQVVSNWLLVTENDWRIEVTVLLFAVYGTFAMAEVVLGVSGVLAVVVLGLLMARRGKYAFSQGEVELVAGASVGVLAHCTETIIFFVAGIAAWKAIFANADAVVATHALSLYVLLHVVRAVTVALLSPALARMGYSLTLKEAVVIVYAGLRGAVGLALGLLVFEDTALPVEARARIHFLVAATVCLTLLINGTTTPLLYAWLHIYPANSYRDVIVRAAVRDIEEQGMAAIREALQGQAGDFLYARVPWSSVRCMVPCFHGVRVLPSNRLHIPPQAFVDIFHAASELPDTGSNAPQRPRLAHRSPVLSGQAGGSAACGGAGWASGSASSSGRRLDDTCALRVSGADLSRNGCEDGVGGGCGCASERTLPSVDDDVEAKAEAAGGGSLPRFGARGRARSLTGKDALEEAVKSGPTVAGGPGTGRRRGSTAGAAGVPSEAAPAGVVINGGSARMQGPRAGAAPAAGGAGAVTGIAPAAGGAGAVTGIAPAAGGAGAVTGITPAAGGAGAVTGIAPAAGGAGAVTSIAPAAGGAGAVTGQGGGRRVGPLDLAAGDDQRDDSHAAVEMRELASDAQPHVSGASHGPGLAGNVQEEPHAKRDQLGAPYPLSSAAVGSARGDGVQHPCGAREDGRQLTGTASLRAGGEAGVAGDGSAAGKGWVAGADDAAAAAGAVAGGGGGDRVASAAGKVASAAPSAPQPERDTDPGMPSQVAPAAAPSAPSPPPATKGPSFFRTLARSVTRQRSIGAASGGGGSSSAEGDVAPADGSRGGSCGRDGFTGRGAKSRGADSDAKRREAEAAARERMLERCQAEQREEIVTTLFASLRASYAEQYEHKQVSGDALATLLAALGRGLDMLHDVDGCTAAAVFLGELEFLLSSLPSLQPPWRAWLLRLPWVGERIWNLVAFYRVYLVTETLGGYIRAHDELMMETADDPLLRRVMHVAGWPALDRAQKELEAHQRRHASLVGLQMALLTARRVVEMKRSLVVSYTSTGKLTGADVAQLTRCFDRTLWSLDMARFSLTAPARFGQIISARYKRSAVGRGSAVDGGDGRPAVGAASGQQGSAEVWLGTSASGRTAAAGAAGGAAAEGCQTLVALRGPEEEGIETNAGTGTESLVAESNVPTLSPLPPPLSPLSKQQWPPPLSHGWAQVDAVRAEDAEGEQVLETPLHSPQRRGSVLGRLPADVVRL